MSEAKKDNDRLLVQSTIVTLTQYLAKNDGTISAMPDDAGSLNLRSFSEYVDAFPLEKLQTLPENLSAPARMLSFSINDLYTNYNDDTAALRSAHQSVNDAVELVRGINRLSSDEEYKSHLSHLVHLKLDHPDLPPLNVGAVELSPEAIINHYAPALAEFNRNVGATMNTQNKARELQQSLHVLYGAVRERGNIPQVEEEYAQQYNQRYIDYLDISDAVEPYHYEEIKHQYESINVTLGNQGSGEPDLEASMVTDLEYRKGIVTLSQITAQLSGESTSNGALPMSIANASVSDFNRALGEYSTTENGHDDVFRSWAVRYYVHSEEGQGINLDDIPSGLRNNVEVHRQYSVLEQDSAYQIVTDKVFNALPQSHNIEAYYGDRSVKSLLVHYDDEINQYKEQLSADSLSASHADDPSAQARERESINAGYKAISDVQSQLKPLYAAALLRGETDMLRYIGPAVDIQRYEQLKSGTSEQLKNDIDTGRELLIGELQAGKLSVNREAYLAVVPYSEVFRLTDLETDYIDKETEDMSALMTHEVDIAILSQDGNRQAMQLVLSKISNSDPAIYADDPNSVFNALLDPQVGQAFIEEYAPNVVNARKEMVEETNVKKVLGISDSDLDDEALLRMKEQLLHAYTIGGEAGVRTLQEEIEKAKIQFDGFPGVSDLMANKRFTSAVGAGMLGMSAIMGNPISASVIAVHAAKKLWDTEIGKAIQKRIQSSVFGEVLNFKDHPKVQAVTAPIERFRDRVNQHKLGRVLLGASAVMVAATAAYIGFEAAGSDLSKSVSDIIPSEPGLPAHNTDLKIHTGIDDCLTEAPVVDPHINKTVYFPNDVEELHTLLKSDAGAVFQLAELTTEQLMQAETIKLTIDAPDGAVVFNMTAIDMAQQLGISVEQLTAHTAASEISLPVHSPDELNVIINNNVTLVDADLEPGKLQNIMEVMQENNALTASELVQIYGVDEKTGQAMLNSIYDGLYQTEQQSMADTAQGGEYNFDAHIAEEYPATTTVADQPGNKDDFDVQIAAEYGSGEQVNEPTRPEVQRAEDLTDFDVQIAAEYGSGVQVNELTGPEAQSAEDLTDFDVQIAAEYGGDTTIKGDIASHQDAQITGHNEFVPQLGTLTYDFMIAEDEKSATVLEFSQLIGTSEAIDIFLDELQSHEGLSVTPEVSEAIKEILTRDNSDTETDSLSTFNAAQIECLNELDNTCTKEDVMRKLDERNPNYELIQSMD